MLIGVLTKCLPGPIHIVLWHPQLLFNLCPAIVHLFNWLKVRRSEKGSSSPYDSTAVWCKLQPLVDLNDKRHDFHCKKNKKDNRQQRLTNQQIAFSQSSDVIFPIKIFLLNRKTSFWLLFVRNVSSAYWVVALWFVQRWHYLILQADSDK